MGLPRKLQNMNLYNEGQDYFGRIAELTPPKISHATEDWRGGGMIGAIKIDMGLEALEAEMTLGGQENQFLRQLGETRHDAVLLRALGGFRSDDTGAVTAVELEMRGRWQELDRGNWKAGDDTEFKVKANLSYYREVVDGEELLRIDMVQGIYIVGGVDRYAEIREAIGR